MDASGPQDGGGGGAEGDVDCWNGMPDAGTSVWEGSGSSTGLERRSSSSSGWLPMTESRGGGPVTPSAENEGWESVSSGQSSLSSGRSLWGQCEIVDENMSIGSGSSSGTLTSLPTEAKGGKRENRKYSNPSLPRSMSWAESGHIPGSGDRKLPMEGIPREQPGRIDERQYSNSRMDDRQVVQQHGGGVDLSVGTSSSQGEEGVGPLPQGRLSSKPEAGRLEWEDIDRMSVSSSEREAFGSNTYAGSGGQSQENQGPSLSLGASASTGGYPHPESLPMSGHHPCEVQVPARNTFTSHSQDGHVSGSDDSESFGGGLHISPRNGAGTPVQGRHSESATPTQGRGNGGKGESGSGAAGGEGSGNCWHGRRLNLGGTSSVANGAVSTGWRPDPGRGGGNSYQSRSTSPRKPSRLVIFITCYYNQFYFLVCIVNPKPFYLF